ncbi:uncharacterized protein LY89DRAFT_748218 [Mollisia scopiformis]|uniref:Uncharacterized protein n=1 Tax=Mollisia scopiformis TaxID=149040 RepID=A0A194XA32_MOLSC|nr:uncharacterized protein LY89DRAFT_748218 [Mollisia scopiformis]KUJ17025.1 hypothetical protein LY89DRAFT_748218 [Mollisia scopiformis]
MFVTKHAGYINDIVKPGEHFMRQYRYGWTFLRICQAILPTMTLPRTKAEHMAKFGSGPVSEKDLLPLVTRYPTILKGCIINWADGTQALCWMPASWDLLYWGVPGHSPLGPQVTQWLADFFAVFPSHASRNPDSRDAKVPYNISMAKYFAEIKRIWGVIHAGIWSIQGQEKSETRRNSGPFCHIPTEDSKGGRNKDSPVKAAAVVKIMRQMIPLFNVLAASFDAGSPELYREAVDHREVMAKAGQNVKHWIEDNGEKTLYHLLTAFVQNHSVVLHRDPKDKGMTIEAVCGHFVEGDICVPSIGQRLRLRAGDILQMDSSALAHCLRHFFGERVAVVIISQSTKDGLTRHMSQLPPGEELDRLQAVRDQKDAQKLSNNQELQSEELESIRQFTKYAIQILLDTTQKLWNEDETQDPWVSKKERKSRKRKLGQIVSSSALDASYKRSRGKTGYFPERQTSEGDNLLKQETSDRRTSSRSLQSQLSQGSPGTYSEELPQPENIRMTSRSGQQRQRRQAQERTAEAAEVSHATLVPEAEARRADLAQRQEEQIRIARQFRGHRGQYNNGVDDEDESE